MKNTIQPPLKQKWSGPIDKIRKFHLNKYEQQCTWTKGAICFLSLYPCPSFERLVKTCLKRPLKNRQNKGLKDKWYM